MNATSSCHCDGVIQPGVVYTRRKFIESMGWSETAWRTAVRRGLPIHRDGRSAVVLGDEAVSWLASQPVINR